MRFRLVVTCCAVVLTVLVLMPTAHTQGFCFDAAVNDTARNSPRSIFAADLDGDNDADLAVANYYSDSVSVLKNNGDGTFAAAVNYATGHNPHSVFAADLDGDHDNDLALANEGGNTVSVLKNNGDGTFAAVVTYPAGAHPYVAFAVDLDGDHDADLAVVNEAGNTVSVLMNNGDGTFAAAVDYPTGDHPYSVFAADLDGDDDADLTVVKEENNTVSVLKNNGDGTFAAAVNYPAGTNPWPVIAADLDGDNDTDVAVANRMRDSVSVLKNNGDGTFAAAVSYAVVGYPYSIFAADLDGDNDADLAVANYDSAKVSVLENNGDGTFAAAVSYATGLGPISVFATDLNGDSDADLAVANQYSNNVSVLINCLNQAPNAICQYVSKDADANCKATVSPTEVNNGSWDPEDGTNLTLALVPPGPFPLGLNVVKLIVTDTQGAAETCYTEIGVLDYTRPTVTCPASIMVPNDAGQCGATVTYSVEATDNCTIPTVALSPPSGSYFPVGTTKVQAIATDGSGNRDTCFFDIVVNDVEKPLAECPATIIQGNDAGQCGAVVSYSVTATDNCSGGTVSATPPSGSFFPIASTPVACIAIDATGNADTCYFTVTVTDSEKPVIHCSPSTEVTLPSGQICGAINYSVPVTDNCVGLVSILTPPSGSTLCAGTWPAKCVATDAVGNRDSCSFVIKVIPSCWCPHQGDIYADGVIDVFDVIAVIGIAFSGSYDPQDAVCPTTRGDVDNNGVTDVFDVIYLIAAAFSGGPDPVNPCGP